MTGPVWLRSCSSESACVEVAWMRPAACCESNCVEVADDAGDVLVRDSKNPTGPALIFTAAEWDAFVGGAKDGEFDL